MAHRICLIITKDHVKVPKELPHFYDNGFLVIPTSDDGYQTDDIAEFSKKHPHFDDIFKAVSDNFWEDEIANNDYENMYCELYDYEELLNIEIIEMLHLSNFIIYHYTELVTEIFEECVTFENRMPIENPMTSFNATGINSYNYWKYESCKRRYFENLK
ncbi:hypothetical protein GCM10023210_04930 [Chryseobacterium ginsengisoli]|uniref:Uncharacterized protein n=1 Tax=Chryseobacterium ginsengisoli TaxID=363853 RepID=A0ABP9LSP8_9FLAO